MNGVSIKWFLPREPRFFQNTCLVYCCIRTRQYDIVFRITCSLIESILLQLADLQRRATSGAIRWVKLLRYCFSQPLLAFLLCMLPYRQWMPTLRAKRSILRQFGPAARTVSHQSFHGAFGRFHRLLQYSETPDYRVKLIFPLAILVWPHRTSYDPNSSVHK